MPEPIKPFLIESPNDFAAMLRQARGDRSRTAIAEAAGIARHTVEKYEQCSAFAYGSVVKVLSAAGYRMEVHLIPADTEESRLLADIPDAKPPAYDRMLAFIGANPGSTTAEMAAAIEITILYAYAQLKKARDARAVQWRRGPHRGASRGYWLAGVDMDGGQ
jgi:hypothetical protein